MIKIPGFKDAYHIVPDCNAFPSERVAISLLFFMTRWKEAFGDPTGLVKDNLNSMVIMWGRGKRFSSGFTMDGERFDTVEVVGLAQLQSLIWISLRNSDSRICDTSLVHELTHASIWAVKETDGDPDHLGDIYTGWTVDHTAFINNVNKELCELGL